MEVKNDNKKCNIDDARYYTEQMYQNLHKEIKVSLDSIVFQVLTKIKAHDFQEKRYDMIRNFIHAVE